MPPKTKKSETTRGSKKKKSTESLEEERKSTSNATRRTKDNYSVFILNIQTDGIQSILKEFIAKAKSHKRLAVVPIVLSEVEEEISLEKGNEKTPEKPAVEEDEITVSKASTYHESPEEIFAKTKAKIAKCIEDHDILLAQLDSITQLDLLDYWRKEVQTLLKPAKAEKGGKGGKGDKTAKGDKTDKGTKDTTKAKGKGGKDARGKDKKEDDTKKSEFGDEICQLGTMPTVEFISKPFSQFNAANRDSRALQKFITDHPEDGPMLYILIIGSVSSEFCLQLLNEKYPLDACITICPNGYKGGTFESLSDILAHRDETKSVNLCSYVFPNLSKCEAAERGEEIYKEICWMLYDVETLKRQYANYLANTKEIDVGMKDEDCKVAMNFEYVEAMPEKLADSLVIPLFLDSLLDSVAQSMNGFDTESPQKANSNSVPHLPYIDLYGKKAVEFKNEIMRNIAVSDGINQFLYFKCMQQIHKCSFPSRIWTDINCLRRTSCNHSTTTTSKWGSISTLPQNHDIAYVELLTKDAIAQRLDNVVRMYDYNLAEYSMQRDEIDICFFNSSEQYQETTDSSYIPTKVCFRDFCKYVAEEIKEWLDEQEVLYERQLMQIKLQRRSRNIQFEEISDHDFFFEPSLKKAKGLSQEKKSKETVEPAEITSQSLPSDILSDAVLKDKASQKSKIKTPFFVYNIGDTRRQIFSTRATFRTTGGTVQLVEDKDAFGHILLTVDLDYFGNHFLCSHTYPTPNETPFMRILCSNSSEINIQQVSSGMKSSPSLGEISQISTTEGGGNSAHFELRIGWPTGLEIKTVHDEETGDILAIEQTLNDKTSSESKRVFYSNGTVAVYSNDGFVDILTSNGTIYETMQVNNSSLDAFTTYSGDEGLEIDLKQHMFEKERFEQFKFDIVRDKCKITTPDGYVFETFPGNMVRENRRLHLTEWCDYALGEWYSKLEGGIKSRWVDNKYEVYYQDGTLITSFLYEEPLKEQYFYEESESIDILELHEESDANQSATVIAGNVLDKILGDVAEEHFTTFTRTYKMQHEKYAFVEFEKDQAKISCPDDINIIIRSNELQINIKKEFFVNCAPGKCSVRGCKYPDQQNSVEAAFEFDSQVEPFLNISSGVDAELQVNQNGKRQYLFKSTSCRPKFLSSQEKRIVLDHHFEGYETHNRLEVDHLMDCLHKSNCIIKSTDENVTILQPITSYKDHFKMPIPNLDKFMEKFVHKGQPCDVIRTQSFDPTSLIPDLMTLRTFLMATQYFRLKHPSTAEIFSRKATSLDDVYYSQDFGENVWRILNQEALRTIDEFLQKMKPKGVLPEAAIRLSTLSDLFDDSHYRKTKAARKQIYHQILRHNFCPKYYEFKEANCQVKNMDVFKYKEILDKLDGARPAHSDVLIHKQQEEKKEDITLRHSPCFRCPI